MDRKINRINKVGDILFWIAVPIVGIAIVSYFVGKVLPLLGLAVFFFIYGTFILAVVLIKRLEWFFHIPLAVVSAVLYIAAGYEQSQYLDFDWIGWSYVGSALLFLLWSGTFYTISALKKKRNARAVARQDGHGTLPVAQGMPSDSTQVTRRDVVQARLGVHSEAELTEVDIGALLHDIRDHGATQRIGEAARFMDAVNNRNAELRRIMNDQAMPEQVRLAAKTELLQQLNLNTPVEEPVASKKPLSTPVQLPVYKARIKGTRRNI